MSKGEERRGLHVGLPCQEKGPAWMPPSKDLASGLGIVTRARHPNDHS